MSVSIKTVHLSPIGAGAQEEMARELNSPFMLMPSLSACSSRKLPVPAAQTLFISKSTTTPSLRAMYLGPFLYALFYGLERAPRRGEIALGDEFLVFV